MSQKGGRMRATFLDSVLAICFVCLPACALQYPAELWAPEKAPHWHGENDAMYSIVRWCRQGHYTGFSTANLTPVMSRMCKAIEGGNKICVLEMTDENTSTGYAYVWNDAKNEYELQLVEDTDRKFYLINLYIDKHGIVYDCKGGEGTLKLVPQSKKKNLNG